MRKAMLLLALLMVLALVIACTAPATPPPPQVVKETVVVAGTPQVVEKVVTVTPAPTAAPTKASRPNVVRVAYGPGDVPSLDPNVAEDTTSITMIDNSFIGLTRLNEVTSELMPGMATKWDISADGRTYTFKIRNDVPWVKWDGATKKVVKVQTCPDKSGKTADRVVTAKDFEYGIIRALKPETASPYAYVLAFVVQGADDFNAGKTKDVSTLGVKALDDTTLQLKFKEPAAYNLNIAGLWTAYATPKWLIDGDDCTTARAERWIEPGFFQSFGPYTLKEWVHDSTMTLVKNPFWPGSKEVPQAKIDEIQVKMLDQAAGMAEFEAGNLDVADPVPPGDMDRIRADAKLKGMLVSAPRMCTYYLGFNTKAKFVSNPNLRRALSAGVDRQKLIDTVLKQNQEPAQWFGRPGIAAAPTMKDHPDLGMKFNVSKAKEYLAAALKELGVTADQLDVTYMFNTDSAHQKIAEFVQQQWKDNLGLNVKLTNQEWKVYLVTTKSENTPQIYRMGWCMDYPDENNFVNEVVAVGGSQNPAKNGVPYGGFTWKNDSFEKLVKQAAIEMDPKKRLDLYSQAEQILAVDDPPMIPLYWYTFNIETQPYVKRTFSVSGHQLYYNWQIAAQ
jgi:oligopeptide transport system substrate-binding protein